MAPRSTNRTPWRAAKWAIVISFGIGTFYLLVWVAIVIRASSIIAKIQDRGGRVYYSRVDHRWLTDALGVASMGEISAIHFDDCPDIDDHDVALINNFPEVELLSFARSGITDKQLSVVATLQNVTILGLSDTGISDEGVNYVSRMSTLEVVALNGTRCTDRGVRGIAHLPHLRRLNIENTNVTDAGIEMLADTDLELLNAGSFEITNESLSSVERMGSLKELWVISPNITDEGIDAFDPCGSLTEMHLFLPKVSDEAIESLRGRLSAGAKVVNHLKTDE